MAPFVVLGPIVPAANAQPADQRSSCERVYTAGEYRTVAKRFYRFQRMSPKVHLRLWRMRQCPLHAEARAAMKRTTLRQRKLRRQRQARAARECGTPACNRRLGAYMAAKRGWTGSQFSCLDELWGARESGWNQYADNPTSDAYGIPQALPGSKMGPGWQTSPHVQIRWGLGYIAGRYGTPCGALSHSHSVGWY